MTVWILVCAALLTGFLIGLVVEAVILSRYVSRLVDGVDRVLAQQQFRQLTAKHAGEIRGMSHYASGGLVSSAPAGLHSPAHGKKQSRG